MELLEIFVTRDGMTWDEAQAYIKGLRKLVREGMRAGELLQMEGVDEAYIKYLL